MEGDSAVISQKIRPLNNIVYRLDEHRRRPDNSHIHMAREKLRNSHGNRHGGIDLLVWTTEYEPSDTQHRLLRETKDALPQTVGADVLVGRRSFNKSWNDKTVYMMTQANDFISRAQTEKEVADIILGITKLCKETTTNSRCYWSDGQRKQCNMDVHYSPVGSQTQYCVGARTEIVNCPGGQGTFETECTKVTVTGGPCSVTCGSGQQPVRVTDTSKYAQDCPTNPKPCTGPPCPATTTTTTTTARPTTTTGTTTRPTPTPHRTSTPTRVSTRSTETTATTEKPAGLALWEIILISLGVLALLAFIIALIVCCGRRERRRRQRHQPGRATPAAAHGGAHGAHPRYVATSLRHWSPCATSTFGWSRPWWTNGHASRFKRSPWHTGHAFAFVQVNQLGQEARTRTTSIGEQVNDDETNEGKVSWHGSVIDGKRTRNEGKDARDGTVGGIGHCWNTSTNCIPTNTVDKDSNQDARQDANTTKTNASTPNGAKPDADECWSEETR